jgi:hypothetical protein
MFEMITIRDTQVAAFRQSAIDAYALDAAKHLLTNFPGPSAALGGETGVRAFVQRGIERGRQSGVETEGAVTVLLELWIQFGENFERSPLREFTKNILAHPTLPGDAKADLIRGRHEELTGGCVVVPY